MSRFGPFVLGLVLIIVSLTHAEKITPNAWGIARSRERAKSLDDILPEQVACPEPTCACDGEIATTYYNKLVKYLFRRSKRMVEDFDGKHLVNIHLQISEENLKALYATDNVRTLDAIVSTVIEDSQDGAFVEVKEILLSWYDRLQYAYLYVINSQVVSFVISALVFVASVLMMRHFWKLNVFLVIFINVLCVSVFFRYLDCNRRLEFDKMNKLKSLTSGPNPCEDTKSFYGLISNYNAQKCTEYMMSIHNHEREFCDPLDVTLTLFMKPLERFVEFVDKIIDNSFSKHGYIKGAVYCIIALAFLRFVLPEFLKQLCGLFRSSTSRPQEVIPPIPAVTDPTAFAQTPSVNIQVNLDSKAFGDYVQQIKRDEEKSRAAICNTPVPESPVKNIENIGDGSQNKVDEEVDDMKDCSSTTFDFVEVDEAYPEVKEEEAKKLK